jgi:tetratricopeptide (TPR) repeat protein
MKTLKFLSILFLCVSSFIVNGQDDRYRSAIKTGLGQLSAARQSSEYIAAANHFERIAGAEKNQWLPVYYASYCTLIAGIVTEDKDVKDQYFDKAMTLAGRAGELSPENSEIYTLQGYIEYMKLSVNPMARMSYMKASKKSLEKAIELDPANPRAYFVQAQNTFYTPSIFGGGKKSAKPLFEQAIAKYNAFRPANDILPDWGFARAKKLLEECNQ